MTPDLYTHGLYVQFGCGPTSAPPGWLSYDTSPTLRIQRLPIVGRLGFRLGPAFHPDVLIGDIRKGLPLPPASCSGVYCSHVLEHLAHRDALTAMVHTFEHLEPGGRFRAVTPDLEHLASTYIASREPSGAAQFLRDSALGQDARPDRIVGRVRDLVGNARHLWLWDYPSLRDALLEVGFIDVRRAKFGDSMDARFGEVEEARRWESSLGVEAIRP